MKLNKLVFAALLVANAAAAFAQNAQKPLPKPSDLKKVRTIVDKMLNPLPIGCDPGMKPTGGFSLPIVGKIGQRCEVESGFYHKCDDKLGKTNCDRLAAALDAETSKVADLLCKNTAKPTVLLSTNRGSSIQSATRTNKDALQANFRVGDYNCRSVVECKNGVCKERVSCESSKSSNVRFECERICSKGKCCDFSCKEVDRET